MPSRRKIREATVQFLYASGLEAGGGQEAFRDSFWDFVTEGERRTLLASSWKTLRHVADGREAAVGTFHQRLPAALATLRADPAAEDLVRSLETIAALEADWTERMTRASRVANSESEHLAAELGHALDGLFAIDRQLTDERRRFREGLEDHPALRVATEPIVGALARVERASSRIAMIARPEDFPEQSELARIRESRESIRQLREQADRLASAVLAHVEELDERLAAVIENYAPERIDPVDRAILRLGAHEILASDEVPDAVAINESIELAKRFGGTDSGRFVNGILDRIARGKAAADDAG